MKKNELIQEIREAAIIAIIRGVERENLPPLLDALAAGGIRFAEITFDQTGRTANTETAQSIADMKKRMAGRMHIGAGTVMTVGQADQAMTAGAEFLISPNVNPEVIRHTVAADCVSIPGAMTPTEAAIAYGSGADFVKIFPADTLGLPYIKALMAPLSHIPFLAVGGVNERNLGDFLAAGLAGVGVGSALTPKDRIAAGDFEAISEMAKRYTDAAFTAQKFQSESELKS